MVIKNFQELITYQNDSKIKKKIALVAAADEHSLQALFQQRIKRIVSPILIGDETQIRSLLKKLQLADSEVEIIHAASNQEAASRGVDLVKQGLADGLMKGQIQTRDFLKAIVSREHGIVADGLLSHMVLNEVPAYHKLLLTTDGGMIPEPSLEEKIIITKQGIDLLKRLGYHKPKVALLAAVETVNAKIKSSVEAEDIKIHFQKNYSDLCHIDGPLSFDLAVSSKIAELKGYQSSVAGEADLLVGPDVTATNILGKSMIVFGKGKMAGVIYGGEVPIIMASRASSSEEKYLSLLLASFLGKKAGD